MLKQYQRVVDEINRLEPAMQAKSDEELAQVTPELKAKLADGKSLDDILPEAFAAIREASVRKMNMRHFDVQLIGGMVIHDGKIAEMRTGEGKTLVATLPAYLNALSGNGVHVVTVNDYLAERDAEWMRPLYEFMGLSVGIILSRQDSEDKRAAYKADITYGTNNEFGFDFLRDNMAFQLEDMMQRKLTFAIIDEVDSILIDEARTPLIISGQAEDSSELYKKIDALVPKLSKQEQEGEGHKATVTVPGDFTIDEKSKQAELTEAGQIKFEELLQNEGLLEDGESLYSVSSISLLHHISAALRAHSLFQKDVDYIVRNGQVVIVDEHTGRTMEGRRWSDGLHQAIEAKEKVKIQNESQTLASITFQNYFRQYDKLSGMTGTADTEAFELNHIYGLEVAVIPTNRPMLRDDMEDLIFLTAKDKYQALVENILECRKKKQPVLVGTASIESSEYISQVLNQHKVHHEVLNAKQHEREAHIIAEAGKPGAVTIATNMAGRGTDIVLGGSLKAELAALDNPSEEAIQAVKDDWKTRNEVVLKAGGLAILGTERHESRRIDNQLRGRSGRQGDPGSSRFYLSFEDNLMRIFGNDKLAKRMQFIGWKEGEAIEHRMLTRSIENAQRKVEGRNFDIRKQLLEYDDVANDQRMVIYAQRRELMASKVVTDVIENFRVDVVNTIISGFIPPQSLEEQWDVEGLMQQIKQDFLLDLPIATWLKEDDDLHEANLREKIVAAIKQAYDEKTEQIGAEIMQQIEKQVLLQQLDSHWKEHLAAMDYLRQGIHLRGYAQKNPKQEYKREALTLFTELLQIIKHDVLMLLSKIQVREETAVEAIEEKRREEAAVNMKFRHDGMNALDQEGGAGRPEPEAPKTVVRDSPKVGRNDPCPCGSGKKYKQCHGRLS